MSSFILVRKALKTAFKEAGIKTGLIALDATFNEDKRPPTAGFTPFKTHLAPHAWGLTPAKEFEAGRAELRRHFPVNDVVPKPILAKSYDGNLAALAYGLKTTFQRRQTLPKKLRKDGSTKKRRNTRLRAMTADQKVQLMIALHKAGLRRRLLLRGVEIAAGPDGEMGFRARNPRPG
jgi:hypothetical protein